MSLKSLHLLGAWVVILANAVVGLWTLGAERLPWLRSRALWWCTIAAEVAIFVEVALGAALVAISHKQAQQLHALYGFSALIVVGLLYSYRSQLQHRLYLLYGLGGLFLMGLCIRAMQSRA